MNKILKVSAISAISTLFSVIILALREPINGVVYLIGQHFKVFTVKYLDDTEFIIQLESEGIIVLFVIYALLFSAIFKNSSLKSLNNELA